MMARAMLEKLERPPVRRFINPYRPLPVEIMALKDETDDVRTYTLRFVEPGYYFAFAPGQFNMVTVPGVGEAAISLSSDPLSEEAMAKGTFQHTVRAVGNVTKALAQLEVGDRLWVRGPYGKGWPMEKVRSDLIIIAGGIGIAPLRPVILRRLARPQGRLLVLYGARSADNLIYRNEIQEWERRGARVLVTVDKGEWGESSSYHVGLITDLLDEIDVYPGQGHVFICGPEVMMKSVARMLAERGWPPEEVFVSLERRMECGIKTCGRCQIDSVYVCQDGPVFSYAVARDLLGTDL